MEKKRLIIRMVLVALVLLLIGSAGLITDFYAGGSFKRRYQKKTQQRYRELAEKYQAYLNDKSKEVRELPPTQLFINQLTSEIQQESPHVNLFFWMCNSEGEFLFGIPYDVFDKMNKAYEKYRDVIQADGYYVDRNDFFTKLISYHKQIDYSEFESPESNRIQWRFHREPSYHSLSDPIRRTLSIPAMDDGNRFIGTMRLEIVDSTVANQWASGKDRFEWLEILQEISTAFMVLSALLIWFLLPSWVYIDARQRNVRQAWKWAVLTVVSFGFAWLIYLIVRPEVSLANYCPQCKKELNGTRDYCPHCSFDLSSTFCPQCQYPLKDEWRFCPSCRFDLSGKRGENRKDKPEE